VKLLSTLLELAGLVAVSSAAFLVSLPLGLLVAGVALFAVGWVLED
jgi:hypothetical protein